MIIREVRIEERNDYNRVVSHPLQSWEWGEFREKTGVEVVRLGQFDGSKIVNGFQITLHPIPKIPFTVGYMPKSIIPTREVFSALRDIGLLKRTIFIKLEPNIFQPAVEINQSNIFSSTKKELLDIGCQFGKPLFTKYSFMLDLTKTETELLALMKQKTRYNTGLAKRKGVEIIEDNSPQAFENYLRLTFQETTKRQGFYAHTPEYHRKMWQILHPSGIAHLLTAKFEGEILVTWVVFIFNNVLYYPYGASSSKDRNIMASNLMMWEAIKFGKAHGCHSFDMWGSLGPDPDPKDPWIGFHRFKEGYGSTLMEFVGTYDFVIDQPKYQLYNIADNLRWKLLKFKAKLPF